MKLYAFEDCKMCPAFYPTRNLVTCRVTNKNAEFLFHNKDAIEELMKSCPMPDYKKEEEIKDK